MTVKRTRPEAVRAIEDKRRKLMRVVTSPGPAPMTPRLAEILREMVDRQRARERGSPS